MTLGGKGGTCALAQTPSGARREKNAILFGLGLLIVLFFAGNAARFYKLNFIDRLSAILYDYRLQLTMPRTVDERIVILDIDEKSLKEEGRRPWSRDRLALPWAAANLASRLEGVTKHYGVGIVVGENTRNAVTGFVYRELDHVRVKGKDKPVVIYEPIGLAAEVDKDAQDAIRLFREVRRLYRKRDWDQAS